MTTSINSVNAGSSAATETIKKKSNLSDNTKKELEALGINATDDMSEAEAQSKISKAKQEKQSGNQNTKGNENHSEFEVKSDAKNLASKLGLCVSDDADVEDILNDIGYEIEDMLSQAEKNPSILSTISQYLSELVDLDEQYENITTLQRDYNNAMNMIATNNKISLGL